MVKASGPTQLSRTLGLQSDRFSQYIGASTDFEPSLIDLSPFDPQDESLLSRGTLRKVGATDTFLLFPDSDTPGYEHINQDADEIERLVEPHGQRLIDLYFEIVHPSFPILQKNVFYEKYQRSHREFSPAVLAAVYILAINWWEHVPELASLPRPNVKELERLVRSTLADAMWRPKLSTVQAGLLLSQRPEGDQWAPTAQLVAISQELGLHLDCSDWKIPPWEKGLRKRLAWALYMQDKWGALAHGRPSHICLSNWVVQPLTADDFPDVEWDEAAETAGTGGRAKFDINQGRIVFWRMVQLSEILAEILETFYTIKSMRMVAAAGAHAAQMVLDHAKPIQLKLRDWQQALPMSVRIDPFAGPTMGLPSVGYLHLAYFAAEITLHRRIIRSFEDSSNAAANASKNDSVTLGFGTTLAGSSPAPDPTALLMCRRAAKSRLISAMDFVNRLSPEHLGAFWYFASKTNFALIGTFGSLMWATSPTRDEADWYRSRLGEYRWTLSVSSKPLVRTTSALCARDIDNSNSHKPSTSTSHNLGSSDGSKGLTGFAVVMLDISTGLLNKLPEKPELSATSSMSDMTSLGYAYGSSASLYGTSPIAPARYGDVGSFLDSGSGLYMGGGQISARGGSGSGGIGSGGMIGGCGGLGGVNANSSGPSASENAWNELRTQMESGITTPGSLSEMDSDEDIEDLDDGDDEMEDDK